MTNLRRHDEPFDDTPLPNDNIEAMKARDREEYALRETKVDTSALRTQLIGECPVCLDVFSAETIPCLLVCGHNVCAVCVKSLHHVRCPLCRAKFEDMPMRDVAMCKYIDAVTVAAPVLANVDIKPFIEAKLLQTWQDVARPSAELELKRAVARVFDLTKEKEALIDNYEHSMLDCQTKLIFADKRMGCLIRRINELSAEVKEHQDAMHELRQKMDLERRREVDDMRKELDNLTKSSAAVEASLRESIQNRDDVVRKLKETHDAKMHALTLDYNKLHIKYEQQVCQDDGKYYSLEQKYKNLQHDYDIVTQKVLFHQEASLDPDNAYIKEAETTMRQMRRFSELILQENDELRYRDELCQNMDLHRVYDEICARRSKLEEEMRMVHLHNKHILTRELKSAINQRDCAKGWCKRHTQTIENITKERDQARDELASLSATQMQDEIVVKTPMFMRGNSNNSFPIQLTAESIREIEQMNNCGPGHMVVDAKWVLF